MAIEDERRFRPRNPMNKHLKTAWPFAAIAALALMGKCAGEWVGDAASTREGLFMAQYEEEGH